MIKILRPLTILILSINIGMNIYFIDKLENDVKDNARLIAEIKENK